MVKYEDAAYSFSRKLGIGFEWEGISHFNFMKFMIKCLEGLSPGLFVCFL